MLTKITTTGLLFACFLFIPLCSSNEYDPPDWVKAVVIVPGLLGLVTAFGGALLLIWAQP
jgi:hypothetical protein